ncbi:MAG: glycosyltransferase [Nanoarchaeota archaeon]
MISIIISSRDDDRLERCKQSILKTIGTRFQLIVIQNKEGKRGLSYVYNLGASKAEYEYLAFMHEDIEFRKKDWGNKLISLLNRNDVGLVGAAGTNYLAENGVWSYPGVPFVKGRIIHTRPEDETKEQIDLFCDEEGDFEVIALDGVFLATKKSVWTEIKFDDKNFTGFHYYDLDFSLRVAQKYKILVTTDILIKHYSGGKNDEDWNYFRNIFINKYKSILPFTNQDKKPDLKNIKIWNRKYLI